MHSSVHGAPRAKRTRGPNKPPKAGANKGAAACFGIYYNTDAAKREALLGAVASFYEKTDDPRQRAQSSIHGWATGKCRPTYRWRLVLAPWIPMDWWDKPVEPS